MGDWTTFPIKVAANKEEVKRIALSDLFEGSLIQMAVQLGASYPDMSGCSNTNLKYCDQSIEGILSFKYGTAQDAAQFLRQLEFVLGRSIESMHLSAWYDGDDKGHIEEVCWRCGCKKHLQDGDLINVRLMQPDVSPENIHSIARIMRKDGMDVVAEEEVLVMKRLTRSSLAFHSKHFRGSRWVFVGGGSLVEHWRNGTVLSGVTGFEKAKQMFREIGVETEYSR